MGLQEKSSHEIVTKCMIAAGSNLGSQAGGAGETVALALELLVRPGLKMAAKSRPYQTPAFPPGSGPDFVNAAALFETSLTPAGVLGILHAIESDLGRIRKKRWEARAIDLDLISFGQSVLPDDATVAHWMHLPATQQTEIAPDQLILPHPRLHERGFVLAPLADIAPDWVHPVLKMTVTDMLAALPQAALDGIHPLS